ncbi:WcbI family polysaccharide biosynthesis putative acetyltransferase [uncultured Alteromonas sp.]|jgi:hypothetical protein|uniref:WcbI family polysaccharide biosynthesis putative acetyltransferase n=1 Tax=uncultured Alteromonas sp. TaxID=179113 RepID=UPI0025875082|nr:WcbI family polysaccharide biosynthesis putative acetyltransferase [uncultured Alteromonas sp.]
MKLVVIGNCQARPLANYIEKLAPSVKITATPIVHLLKDSDEATYRDALNEADVIVTQVISDAYPCKFIRTSEIKRLYSDKTHTIVNLYFSGFTPDLIYVRHPDVTTLRGPLGDYHNKTILDGWLLGISQEQVVSWLSDPFYNKQEYGKEDQKSLEELKARDALVDIKIADFIESTRRESRTFFTFNHPASVLLIEYAERICQRIVGARGNDEDINTNVEPLNQLIPIVPPGIQCVELGRSESKGTRVLSINGPNVELGEPAFYTNEELVSQYYAIYEQNAEFLRSKYDA